MPRFTDQLGREIELPTGGAKRIVSLVPSISESVCDLEATDALVGITSFCVHPDSVYRSRTRVGGTKNFKIDRIRALEPDLILANKEENPKRNILELAESFPVWVSDVSDVQGAAQLMDELGILLNRHVEADLWSKRILEAEVQLQSAGKELEGLSALYLIWKDPYMAAGTDTFISSVMEGMGIRNALRNQEQSLRYPAIDEAKIEALQADLIFLSSEPYPFAEKHCQDLDHCSRLATICVDGEAFSWYGSRFAKRSDYLLSLLRQIQLLL